MTPLRCLEWLRSFLSLCNVFFESYQVVLLSLPENTQILALDVAHFWSFIAFALSFLLWRRPVGTFVLNSSALCSALLHLLLEQCTPVQLQHNSYIIKLRRTVSWFVFSGWFHYTCCHVYTQYCHRVGKCFFLLKLVHRFPLGISLTLCMHSGPVILLDMCLACNKLVVF